MMDMHTIRNDRLSVNFMLPRTPRVSERFDACGVVNEVLLDGKHTFCVPEQLIPGRVTTWGLGLCGEFVTSGIASQAKQGEQFPKFGVGLLTQREEGGEHSVWRQYGTEPFEISVEQGSDCITFTEEPKPCLGYAARVRKEYRVEENRLILTETFENTGEKTIPLQEYQHNFVCIDHLPVGAGYHLELPFDRKIKELEGNVSYLGEREALDGIVSVKGQTMHWLDSMEGKTWFQILDQEDVLPQEGYYWKLSHDRSPAYLTESLSFVPGKVVLWGIEHCICVELYYQKEVAPGETVSWQRIWTFGER